LQIRKYLNGELDAKAMHQLERQAQDDPFLMDALEGYGSAKADQQKHLDELSARLKNRIEPKKGRIIPFRFLSIAASVLVVCSVGVWWFYKNAAISYKTKARQTNVVSEEPKTLPPDLKKVPAPPAIKPEEKNEIASKTQKKVSRAQATATADQAATEIPPTVRELEVGKPIASNDVRVTAPRDTTPVDEMIVTEYKAKKSVDTSLYVRKAEIVSNGVKKLKEVQIQGKAPGVTIQSNAAKASDLNKLASQGNVGGLVINQLLSNQSIQGRVIAQDDGLPIQGASVKIAGTNKVTQTDADGRFQLKADSSRDKLVIAGIGYQTRQLSANNRDSVKNIALQPSSSALSEVVVTRYTSQNKDTEETTVISAHPQNGWGKFRKYLKENGTSPDHKTGVVKLSFEVDRYGSITAIKVLKGISPAADKKAADLIKDGPEWTGNSNKLPETVTLKIKFL